MNIDKKRALIALVWFVVGCVCGIFVGKGMYDHPIEESVTRDTITLHDTVPDIAPTPKDSLRTRWVTRWLPVHSTDTVDRYVNMTDTVAVEIPITSKHYGGKNYDAYVSGFEPSLDSIFVYNETQIITERVTISKPPNKVALFLEAGVDYTFNGSKIYTHAGGELVFNNHKRVQIAVEGGVAKTPLDDRANPYAGGKVKIRLF